MADGPIDCVVLQFEDGRFHGDLVSGLVDLVAQNIIRILDLVLLTHTPTGAVTAIEIDDLDEDARELFFELEGEYDGLLSHDDLQFVADLLTPGSFGVAIVWENTWASAFMDGIRTARGELVMNERIARSTVEQSLARG